MKKKYEVSADEKQLFLDAMQENIAHHVGKAPEGSTSPSRDLQSQDPRPEPTTQRYLFDKDGYFASAGLQLRTIKRLKSGQINIDRKVDLHGQTIREATWNLQQLLSEAKTQPIKTVLIIHGKGKGALRGWLLDWLPQQQGVLAWQPAATAHGGRGAGILLIKGSTKRR